MKLTKLEVKVRIKEGGFVTYFLIVN